MDLAIKGRVALISGASGGIGLATARLPGEEGAPLVPTDMHQAKLQDTCAGLPGEPLSPVADMTNQKQVDLPVAPSTALLG